ncbi:hypothetical protein C8R46DRAFT_1135309 [Mycena filopes]|nr:hypothetical protein C8R46DRAFT_1135309 [Mycena filopes]
MPAPFVLPMHLFPLDFTRRRITEVDAEILALKEALSKAKLERKVLKQHLANYIYPVLTLPNEVVSEIFLQTLDGFPSLCGPASPIYLGHICQRWRDIALSTPSIWSSMSIFIIHHSRAPQGYHQLLELWLARSRKRPLSITFTDGRCSQVGTAHPAMGAILAHRKRWETVALNMPAWDTLPDIQGDLPLLRSIEIQLVHPSTTGTVQASPKVFSGPKLATVTLSGLRAHMVGLPWTQLTSITIEASLEPVAQILRAASNLRELLVRPLRNTRDPDNWCHLLSITPLMHLRTYIFAYGTPGMTSILRSLTLPALKYMELPVACGTDVVQLLMRSHCPLDGLRINMSGVEYLPFLQSDGTIVLEVWENEENESDESEASEDNYM